MVDVSKRAGERVRKARESLGLSQANLAESVDLSPGQVGQIERGTRGFSIGSITRIAKSLGLLLNRR